MKKPLLSLMLMLASFLSHAQLSILKDINQATDPKASGIDALSLTDVNGVLFFNGRSAAGQELWKSDGTVAGTLLVKDINPGSSSSNPSSLVNVNGTLYFLANDGTTGTELWKSNGTEAGTVLVKDIQPGSNSLALTNLVAVGNILFFTLVDGTGYLDLWSSDGTSSGTFLLKNNAISVNSSANLANVNGTLFFTGQDAINGLELWKSNGTAAGTVLVKDIYTGTNASTPDKFCAVGTTLYFSATDGTTGVELWKSDGTSGGTVLVKDLNAGATNTYPDYLIDVAGTLFFVASDGINTGLWKTDGTDPGTTFIKDPQDESFTMDNLTVSGGILYFTIDTNELWKSDGTAAGTSTYKSIGGYAADFTDMDGTLYFVAQKDLTPGSSLQVWKSDGTVAGTTLVTDIPTGTAGGTRPPNALTAANSILYFVADDNTNGNELWKTDGTPGGTARITDIPATNAGSGPEYLAAFNGNLYFAATTDNTGTELWKSDGTDAGTALLKDIYTGGSNSSDPSYIREINGKLYFVANSGTGNKLWKSDGSVAGTVEVGGSPSDGSEITGVLNTIYFPGNDAVTGVELWKSDGTLAGTTMVTNIAGATSSKPSFLTNFNDKLYFIANEGSTVGLWTSDGTVGGTVNVKSFNFIRGLRNQNGILYFIGDDGTNGLELWKSDGTTAGTVLVKDIRAGVAGSFTTTDAFEMETVNGVTYFVANDGTNGRELWKTDGTTGGTVLVLDINMGSVSSSITKLKNANGILYFSADDGSHGVELWTSDGTGAGTTMITDINTGTGHSYPDNMFVLNGFLYFTAFDGTNRTLWKSNGRTCGTLKVTNNTTVSAGGISSYMAAIGQYIYITGYETGAGNEIFVHDTSTDLPTPAGCRLDQTITFNAIAPKTYGDAPFTLSATSDAGLPVQYESADATIVSIVGDQATILKAGTVDITAKQPGNADYDPATPVTVSLVINKADQTITFPDIADKTFGDAPFTLSATSDAALTIQYTSSDPTVASISGSQVTILKAGPITITASQPGDGNYNAATPVTKPLVINKASQTITFPDIADKTLGDAPFTLTGTSTSGLALSYNTTTPLKVSVSGSTVTLLQAGTATIVANQAGDANYNPSPVVEHSFCVNPVKPTIAISQSSTATAILTSSSTTGNAWFKDGVKIPNENGSSLTVVASGAYTVQVTIDGCTSVLSENADIVITGIENSLREKLAIYPNPVDDKLTIQLPVAGRKEISIVSIHGSNEGPVYTTEQSSLDIYLPNYAAGIYTVRVTVSGKTVYTKFVKR
ncbi:MAG TPA: ELWxxDGT repeat protein [Ohtaekwangia sp.]|uniref:ELWxxDGT repeat protein n=1 Tax=Ohtaekwangia sp. TaxID=2066019 RepID=UPI002F932A7F